MQDEGRPDAASDGGLAGCEEVGTGGNCGGLFYSRWQKPTAVNKIEQSQDGCARVQLPQPIYIYIIWLAEGRGEGVGKNFHENRTFVWHIYSQKNERTVTFFVSDNYKKST